MSIVEELKKENASLRQTCVSHETLTILLAEKDAEIAHLKEQLKLAVEDIKHRENCDVCKWANEQPDDCDFECLGCKLRCSCRECRNEDKWEWRGLKGE